MMTPSAGAASVISASWRLGTLKGCPGRVQLVARLVESCLRAGAAPEELAGAPELRLAVAHARLPLHDRGSELAIVEFRQRLPLAHRVALVGHELRQPADHLGTDGQHDHGLDRSRSIDRLDRRPAYRPHHLDGDRAEEIPRRTGRQAENEEHDNGPENPSSHMGVAHSAA